MYEIIFKSGKIETILKIYLKSFLALHKKEVVCYRLL